MGRMRPAARTRRLAAAGAAGACGLAAAGAAPRRTAASPRGAARAAPAQTETTAVVRDPVDTAGGLDLTRVQLGRAPDGRLRAALTLAAPWRMRDLPAGDGPPGSLCLRMWTTTTEPGTFPDFLLCITADTRGRHLRGDVLV